ncbi:hypothetical protein B0H10DRAFT_2240920 [Mycena sp. CBHHK59/15]|nr:hypothetical protein B0H10DRAFT_2240920 [Mycena sp. CBHHK59/15]
MLWLPLMCKQHNFDFASLVAQAIVSEGEDQEDHEEDNTSLNPLDNIDEDWLPRDPLDDIDEQWPLLPPPDPWDDVDGVSPMHPALSKKRPLPLAQLRGSHLQQREVTHWCPSPPSGQVDEGGEGRRRGEEEDRCLTCPLQSQALCGAPAKRPCPRTFHHLHSIKPAMPLATNFNTSTLPTTLSAYATRVKEKKEQHGSKVCRSLPNLLGLGFQLIHEPRPLLDRNGCIIAVLFAAINEYSRVTDRLLTNTSIGRMAGFADVLGVFDHTKGRHLVLRDLKLKVEFPASALILLPSATVAHSNVPVQQGEEQASFTQFNAGEITVSDFQTRCRYREKAARSSELYRDRKNAESRADTVKWHAWKIAAKELHKQSLKKLVEKCTAKSRKTHPPIHLQHEHHSMPEQFDLTDEDSDEPHARYAPTPTMFEGGITVHTSSVVPLCMRAPPLPSTMYVPAPTIMLCTPIYTPDLGHEDRHTHNAFFFIVAKNWKGICRQTLLRMLKKYPDVWTFHSQTWSRFLDLWNLDCQEYHNHEGQLPSTPNSSMPSSPSTLTDSTTTLHPPSPVKHPLPSLTKTSLLERQRQCNTQHDEFLAAEDTCIMREASMKLSKDDLAFLAGFRLGLGPISPQHVNQLFAHVLGLPSAAPPGLQHPIQNSSAVPHGNEPPAVIHNNANGQPTTPGPWSTTLHLAAHEEVLGEASPVLDRVVPVLKGTPGTELMFSHDEGEVWDFLAKEVKGCKVDFHDTINKEFSDRNAAAARIAQEFSKKESYVRSILCSISQFKSRHAQSLHNAVLHQLWLDKDEGDKKDLHELRQNLAEDIEDSTIVLGDINDKDQQRLINQLLEHRMLKRRGVRGTTKVSQLDARQTVSHIGDALVDLHDYTGVRSVVFFTRGNADNPALPHCVDSDDPMSFLLKVLQIAPLDFLRKFEQWSCTQDEGSCKKSGINDVRKEVSKLMQDGLRKIKNNNLLLMEYVNYDLAICRTEWGVETAWHIHDMLCSGTIHWVVMTKTQHAALVAEHNTKHVELGASALRKRRPRSDKSVPRGPHQGKTKMAAAKKKARVAMEEEGSEEESDTGEKEGEGVQPTEHAASTALAAGHTIASIFWAPSTTAEPTPTLFDLAAYPRLQPMPEYRESLEINFDPELMQLLQSGMEEFGLDFRAGSMPWSGYNGSLMPPTPSQPPSLSTNTNTVTSSSKRKRTTVSNDSEDAPPIKKLGKTAENTPPTGEAPPKVRKKHLDAGTVKGPRKSH